MTEPTNDHRRFEPRNQTAEERNAELSALDAAHIQNETARDTFLALGHTALFAASISFIGQLGALNEAIWRPVIYVAWLSSVIGLLGHTASFGAARRLIDARRAEIFNIKEPDPRFADRLNVVSLWTFPIALVSVFVFVVANVSMPHGQQETSASPAVTTQLQPEGNNAATEEPKPQALDRSHAFPKGTGSAAPSTSTAE